MPSLATWKGRYNRDSDWHVRSYLGTEDSGRGWALQCQRSLSSDVLFFRIVMLKRPAQSDNTADLVLRTHPWAKSFSSNLARKKWRLEGNRETGETVAEETKTAKSLSLRDFPMTLEKIS